MENRGIFEVMMKKRELTSQTKNEQLARAAAVKDISL